ncbi:unnamed protein product [marine sediment metagenome]|uniref:Uncharacterized protein n=2 Tax=marine sediment metagenome TaxID=412755 RepID=X1J7P9_9ZZZZ
MGKEEEIGIGDVYPQWVAKEFRSHETDASKLRETELITGLDMFSERAWLIHEVEFDLSEIEEEMYGITCGGVRHILYIAAGRAGLGNIGLHIPGVAAYKTLAAAGALLTEGSAALKSFGPLMWTPPGGLMPWAARKMSFYVQFHNDNAALQNLLIVARVAFTVIKTTSKLWRELAERWHLVE